MKDTFVCDRTLRSTTRRTNVVGVWTMENSRTSDRRSALETSEGDEADEGLDKVALGSDYVLDVLVRLRRLGEIEPVFRLAEAAILVPPFADDAVHRLVALLHRERGRCGDAAHAASRAVRAAHE